MKRRIIRHDSYNWAIQEWQEGGGTVERGRYTGQTMQSRWKAPTAFYSTLAAACVGMLDEIVADNWTGQNVRETIESAKAEVAAMVADLAKQMQTDTMVGLLQERGWTVTAGKKGRTSYVEDAPAAEETEE